jgi:anti-sigma factor RsiW
VRCEETDARIEALAAGEEPDDAALQAHVASCRRCASRLALARAIESLLAIREVPEPPANFTAGVMARIRRERWRAEQMLDAGFNFAVVFGLVLIVGGLGGLGWSMGLFGADAALGTVVNAATSQLVERLLPQAPTVVVATLLLASALGLWWWAEEGFA